jgi:ferric-dicitrate binding protein FerR (iron transport regulator)
MSYQLNRFTKWARKHLPLEKSADNASLHANMPSSEMWESIAQGSEAAKIERAYRKQRNRRLLITGGIVFPFLIIIGYGIIRWVALPGRSSRLYVISQLSDRPLKIYDNVANLDPMDISLPDGSQVRLAAGSRFMYSADFGNRKRETYLTGQASFNVKTDKNKPFIIHAGSITFRMLGTLFNVTANVESQRCEITLVSGTIEMSNGHRNKLLRTGEKALIERDLITVRQPADPKKYLLWSGERSDLEAEDADLDMLIRRMACWYKVKVINPDHVRGIVINGNFKKKDPLDKNLALLRSTERWYVRLELRNDTIFLLNPSHELKGVGHPVSH